MKDINKVGIMFVLLLSFLSYTGFLYQESINLNVKLGTSADNGKKLWQENNCIACHQIYGLGGYLGPDLTNTYSEKGQAHIIAFLRSGTNVMPNFNLTDSEIEDLVHYLKSIDDSGTGRPSKLKINYDGTIAHP